MKTNTVNRESIKGILILSIILTGMLCASVANAQRPPRGSYSFGNYYRGSNTFILGVEGGVSTRSFVVKSDIDGINQLKVAEEGWSTALVIGGKNMNTRLVFGNYNTSSTVSKEVGQRSFGTQVSLYPFKLLGVKSKYFQPYLITGIELSTIRFTGTYIPQPKKPELASKEECQCQCEDGSGSGLPADPDQVPSGPGQASSGPPPNPGGDPDVEPVDEEQVVKPAVDKLLATQALAGLGLEISFKDNNRFYSMFSEARYGIPLGVEALTSPLLNTSISGQLALYFGVRIGLSK